MICYKKQLEINMYSTFIIWEKKIKRERRSNMEINCYFQHSA